MRRWLILGLLGLVVVVSGVVTAPASDAPSFPTDCASGIVVDRIPGEDLDPASVGPVVVDSALSKQLYGDSVNVLDGISEEEVPVVKEVASKIKWCWEPQIDGWGAFMPQ